MAGDAGFLGRDAGRGRQLDRRSPDWTRRGEGIGRRLLIALIADARARGWSRLSLSVERANRAAALYRAAGFAVVAFDDDADTMALDL